MFWTGYLYVPINRYLALSASPALPFVQCHFAMYTLPNWYHIYTIENCFATFRIRTIYFIAKIRNKTSSTVTITVTIRVTVIAYIEVRNILYDLLLYLPNIHKKIIKIGFLSRFEGVRPHTPWQGFWYLRLWLWVTDCEYINNILKHCECII